MFDDLDFFPDAASRAAGQVDAVYFYLLAISAFFVVLIWSVLAYFSVRYRRRRHVRAERLHGSTLLEIAWSAVPLVLILAAFGWGAKVYVDVFEPPDETMEILVTGKQWMWKLQHPTGQREINELHVPIGRPISLTLTSEDVIHSFYVPAFRIKRDVVPGMYTRVWFEPTRRGRYHLFCAEYCGTKHSEMIGEVVVLDEGEYEAWLSGQTSDQPPEEAGRALFSSLRCETCHAAGSGQRGPHLAGRFGTEVPLADGRVVTFDEEYVRESILTPRKKVVAGYEPLMPTYQGQVTEGQILQLIAYVKSLAEAGSAEAEAEEAGE